MLALGACGRGGGARVTHHLAVDWEGTLTGGLLGPSECHPERASGDVLEPAGDRWRAVRPGVAVVPCRDGVIEVIVQRASHHIDVPTTLRVGERAMAQLVGSAPDGQELALGPDIEWELTGTIDVPRREGCMSGMFDGLLFVPTHRSIEAREPGAGTIRARIDGQVYDRVVNVVP